MSEEKSKIIRGLSRQTATDGLLKISQIPGPGGIGPRGAFIVAYAHGLPPSDGSITMRLWPGGNVTHGTDANGDISAYIVMTEYPPSAGDGKHFGTVFHGLLYFENGFWEQPLRAEINILGGSYDFAVNFTTSEPIDYAETLAEPPHSRTVANISYDPETNIGQADFSFQYDNTLAEDPIGFAILRDGEFIASIPANAGQTLYEFTDTVFDNGIHTYEFMAYKETPDLARSAYTSPLVVDFTIDLPDINVEGSGGIDFGGAPSLVFIQDPSGIYTLVPGKTHDTLYERLPGITSQDLKIPDPYVVTGFFGE